jgi:hypothetical protein
MSATTTRSRQKFLRNFEFGISRSVAQDSGMPRVTITVPGTVPQPYRFPIDRQKIRLGRASDNDIVIECVSISQHHAEITRTTSGYALRDLGSTNGMKFNDVRTSRLDLAEVGRIRLGDVQLEFLLTAEESAEIDAETPRLPKLPEAAENMRDEHLADEPGETEGEPKRKKKPRRPLPVEVSYNPRGVAALVGIAILALLVGANLRHYHMTGRSLIAEAFATKEAPATGVPAPAAPAGE